MLDPAHLQLDFDAKKSIVHLSGRDKVIINTPEELNLLCLLVNDFLAQHGSSRRCYMIVNISQINISPDLSDNYREKVGELMHRHLYPDGLVRYGYGITRITAQKASMNSSDDRALLFANHREALEFIDEMIARNTAAEASQIRQPK